MRSKFRLKQNWVTPFKSIKAGTIFYEQPNFRGVGEEVVYATLDESPKTILASRDNMLQLTDWFEEIKSVVPQVIIGIRVGSGVEVLVSRWEFGSEELQQVIEKALIKYAEDNS